MALQAVGRVLGVGQACKTVCLAALQRRPFGGSAVLGQAEPQLDVPPAYEEPRWLRELGAVRTDWT